MRQNITKIKTNQYEKLDRTKQKPEDDSATFCFVITFIMILRSSTYLLANSSPHMQQFAQV